MPTPINSQNSQDIAIVGIACRFPGAPSVEEFWNLLREGRECVRPLTPGELTDAGVTLSESQDSGYVSRRGVLDRAEHFDAAFFGMSPREALLTDPQQRLMLECAWHVLEDAGYGPGAHAQSVGVYAAAGWNSHFVSQLLADPELLTRDSAHSVLLGNEKDSLAARVAYKLNLVGPAVTVQSACSSSLVAVGLASRSLLAGDCDMAIAGGVAVELPQAGYRYRPEGILSPTGQCRAFDFSADGTVLGGGVGLVALKRVADAIRSGDHVYAVIKSTALNNDGSRKAGFTAPSVAGQVECIRRAISTAGIRPDDVSYVEAHGTGTQVGDPIELRALQGAYGSEGATARACMIGSVKTNIGHLDAAAGIAGLIKVALMLDREEMVPSLHFEKANSNSPLTGSRFRVCTAPHYWAAEDRRRLAAVSSFGLGGTNAHAILEAAPSPRPGCAPVREAASYLLRLSAKSQPALTAMTKSLAASLEAQDGFRLEDVAHSLKVGRQPMGHRTFVVADSRERAASKLRQALRSTQVVADVTEAEGVMLLFPGQGCQFPGMASAMYRSLPAFARHLDTCLEILRDDCDLDLTTDLLEADVGGEHPVHQTWRAQPAIFAFCFAMARTWMDARLPVSALAGHSVGECVAAALAGVMSLRDALTLVARRGRFMQAMVPGAMLAVAMDSVALERILPAALDLAAVNEPQACVVSGPAGDISAFEQVLRGQDIQCRLLRTSHGFHSRQMAGASDDLLEHLKSVTLHAPSIPIVSSVTGDWLADEEATSREYWARQLREPVQFSKALETAWREGGDILLECGPARLLASWAMRHPERTEGQVAFAVLSEEETTPADASAGIAEVVGQLWSRSVALDEASLLPEGGQRVPLPGYPFDGPRFRLVRDSSSSRAVSRSTNPNDGLAVFWTSLRASFRQGSLHLTNGSPTAFDLRDHRRRMDSLNVLCEAYAFNALRVLEIPLDAQGSSLDAYSTARGVLPRFQQIVVDLVRIARNSKLSAAEADAVHLPALVAAARRDWSDAEDVIDLSSRCGSRIVDVLTGRLDPLQMFSDVISDGQAPSQYGPGLERAYRDLLKRAVGLAQGALGVGQRLRVLEVGGGTGIATSDLLPLLRPESTEYKFTDIGGYFVSRARLKFGHYKFVDFATLDLDRSPLSQGFAEQTADIVVAVNMLHATRDIARTLRHVRSLLAPGGVLVAWEITRSTPEFCMTYGLLMQPVEDLGRSQGAPFLTLSQWQEQLRAAGFDEVESAPSDLDVEQHLLIARVADVSGRSPIECMSESASSGAERSTEHDLAGQSALRKKSDLAQWFYEPAWERASLLPSAAPAIQEQRILIVADDRDEHRAIAELLRRQGRTVTVWTREQGHPHGAPSRASGLMAVGSVAEMLDRLKAANQAPTHIVHCAEASVKHSASVDERGGFGNLLAITQWWGTNMAERAVSVLVVTDAAHDVTGTEVVSATGGLRVGFCRAASVEYPLIAFRAVDVVLAGGESHWHAAAAAIAQELARVVDRTEVIAWRNGHRWRQTVRPLRVEVDGSPGTRLRAGGTYLITGGFGKIGLAIARHLLQSKGARVLLVGRSAVPDRDQWQRIAASNSQDPLATKARVLLELSALGGEVRAASADVADAVGLEACVADFERMFGRIDGVIHSAGLLGDGAIQSKRPGDICEVLAPKLAGTLAISEVFANRGLDFLALFSSLSSRRPGFGQVAYCAANSFVDAFAAQASNLNPMCLSWDVWKGDGLAYDASAPALLENIKRSDFASRGIDVDEGVKIFCAALDSGQRHLLVCTSDYLVRDDIDLTSHYADQAVAQAATAPAVDDSAASGDDVSGTSTHAIVSRIWCELLGLKGIGLDDDFFQLGGDSLIGTLVVSRLRTHLGVTTSNRTIYEHPTVRSLSSVVEAELLAMASSADLEAALRSVESS